VGVRSGVSEVLWFREWSEVECGSTHTLVQRHIVRTGEMLARNFVILIWFYETAVVGGYGDAVT
jgi:hypothetical protein